MTGTNHVITGAVIGAAVHQPWLALPLALASHFACDALPHFDLPGKVGSNQFYLWLIGDMALAASILTAIWFLHPANAVLVVACGAVAASPDLMWGYYILYKHMPKKDYPLVPRFHIRIQRWTSPKYWPVELGWLTVMTYVLLTQLRLP